MAKLFSLADMVKAKRAISGKSGKKNWTVPKGTTGVVAGMVGGQLAVNFPEQPMVRIEKLAWVEKTVAGDVAEEPEKKNKLLSVPKGCEFLRGGGQPIQDMPRAQIGGPAGRRSWPVRDGGSEGPRGVGGLSRGEQAGERASLSWTGSGSP